MQTDSGILPVAEPLLAVNVFVRKINAARESRMTVDHGNFPVVTVI